METETDYHTYQVGREEDEGGAAAAGAVGAGGALHVKVARARRRRSLEGKMIFPPGDKSHLKTSLNTY